MGEDEDKDVRGHCHCHCHCWDERDGRRQQGHVTGHHLRWALSGHIAMSLLGHVATSSSQVGRGQGRGRERKKAACVHVIL